VVLWREATITAKNGTINKYRSEALQIQFPPDKSMARLRTNVDAKNNEARIPIAIAFTSTPISPMNHVLLS